MIEMRQILCPVDFSECSQHALERAVMEPGLLGSVTEKMLRSARPARCSQFLPVQPRRRSCLFKRVVCAIDFSDCSLRGLECAPWRRKVTRRLPSRTVAHVFELEGAMPKAVMAGGTPYREILRLSHERRGQSMRRVRAGATLPRLLSTARL